VITFYVTSKAADRNFKMSWGAPAQIEISCRLLIDLPKLLLSLRMALVMVEDVI